MRNKKIIIFKILLLLLLIPYFSFSQKGTRNPAVVYAEKMEIELETRHNIDGGAYLVCLFPDGSECSEWDFFRGICGQQYSYCIKKGWLIRTDTISKHSPEESYTIICPICYKEDEKGKINSVMMLDLMKQNGDL